jgi:two-component system, chemotaxis family, CheB/CheR fusion protein
MMHSDDPLKGLTILLVEDASDTREVLTRLLEADGAHVISAGSASEGAVLAVAHDIDVLLTDLGLPDIPGDALIRKVVAEASRRPRVIAITGYGEPFVSRARSAGADAVLTKPVSWSRLIPLLTAKEREDPVAA